MQHAVGRCDEARLEAELVMITEQVVVRLPANYETLYRRAIADLEDHLSFSGGRPPMEQSGRWSSG
ncbi:hypothetical protein [Sphingobium aromaticiconvertens]|uniref:hypothetical protein n=1 Tax=Sphingobium aromaticiconvertens TaxID=365341 RepID=UPI0030193B81